MQNKVKKKNVWDSSINTHFQSHIFTYMINWLNKYRSSVKQHMSADKCFFIIIILVPCSLFSC